MNKNTKLAYAVLSVLFVLFNVIAFVVPTVKNTTFWVAYAFVVVAFIAQIFIWKFGFKGNDTLKSKFLGVPIIHVGIVYLVITLIASAVFIILPTIELWIAIIILALIAGVSVIFTIGTEVARDEIERVEKKVAQKVFYIRELQVDVEMLMEQEKDDETKAGLKKLAEKIRFSDPMSNEHLADMEEQIKDKMKELKVSGDKIAKIKELDLLISERNKKVKMMK